MSFERIRTLRRSLPTLGVGALLGVFIATCAQPTPSPSKSQPSSGSNGVMSDLSRMMSPSPAFARASEDGRVPSLADVAERAVPSVVNVSTTRVIQGRSARNPLFEHPGLREFFGPRAPRGQNRPRGREQHGLGSGVIVSADGVILTNNHVVEQADDIQVTLADGREFEAALVGTDPQSDLAVVRIQGEVGELTPVPFGDSSALRLGDVVLAIGNPFGVGQTVTMGIVSATGRSGVGIVDYEDFIQTDAAINPGNSGGALINMRGELVGINTAILSRSGGYQGIGFAIPADMARPIMDSLLTDGRVARGWLGVAIQTLDKDLSEAMNLGVTRGILVSDVSPDSPAARAGLQRGDVIVSLDGEAVTENAQLRNRIAAAGPEAKVELVLVRQGAEKTVTVELGALSQSPLARAEPAVGSGEGRLEGVRVAELDDRARRRFEIPATVDAGVVVVAVEPGSAVARVGLRPGDVILEIDRKPVDSVASFRALDRASEGPTLLLVHRGGNTIYLALR